METLIKNKNFKIRDTKAILKSKKAKETEALTKQRTPKLPLIITTISQTAQKNKFIISLHNLKVWHKTMYNQRKENI